MSIDNNPTPDPVPQPPDDDDDDQRMYWPDAGNGTQLTLYALGTTDPAAVGNKVCCAGLFACKEGFVPAFDGTTGVCSGASGSQPAAVGRQLGRWYESTIGGGDFLVSMAAPEVEILGGGVRQTQCPDTYQQLHFAWLTGDQYQALRQELNQQAKGAEPLFDPTQANHDALTFASSPQYTITQPTASVKGTLKADLNLTWLDIRVTLFGSCGPGNVGGTPRTWAFSAPAAQLGGTSTWVYGDPPAAPPVSFKDSVYGGDPVHEVWVAAWGWYELGGKKYAAVAPPMVVNRSCKKTNLGVTGRNSTPLPNTTMGSEYFDSFRAYVHRYDRVPPLVRVPGDEDEVIKQANVQQALD